MINLDDELTNGYLLECRRQTEQIRVDLATLRVGELDITEKLVNRAFQSLHSIRGVGLLGLGAIRELAHQMEEVLGFICSREMDISAHRMVVLRHAAELLHTLMMEPRASNDADTAQIMSHLAGLCTDDREFKERSGASAAGPRPPHRRSLRTLVVEDDCASRLLLQTFLKQYGICDVAGNGREAVDKVRFALERSQKYDLVCMDIMMPELDGRDAVRQIRALELASSVLSTSISKIIMTTVVDDAQEVFRCFRESCDAYLLKPIDLTRLLSQMKSFQLVE